MFARGDLCVRVQLCAQSNLLRMYTTCALEAPCAYEYVLARKGLMHTRYDLCARGNLCIWGTNFARKVTYASWYLFIASTWRWQLMVSSLKFVMTVDGILERSSRCNDRQWSVRLLWPSWFVALNNLSKGCDLLSFLCDDLDFGLGRPYRRVWSSVFSMQWSWLLIGPSFLCCLEASVVIFLWHWSVWFKPRPSPDDDYLLNPV